MTPLCYVLGCSLTYHKVGVLSSLYQSQMSNYFTPQSCYSTFHAFFCLQCFFLVQICSQCVLKVCLKQVGGVFISLNYKIKPSLYSLAISQIFT